MLRTVRTRSNISVVLGGVYIRTLRLTRRTAESLDDRARWCREGSFGGIQPKEFIRETKYLNVQFSADVLQAPRALKRRRVYKLMAVVVR